MLTCTVTYSLDGVLEANLLNLANLTSSLGWEDWRELAAGTLCLSAEGESEPSAQLSATPRARYRVGGTVLGLTGGTLILQNNRSEQLPVTENGAFTFLELIVDGSGYSVTVLSQPAGHICEVGNGAGTIAGADVTDVSVRCATGDIFTLQVQAYGIGDASGSVTSDPGDIFCRTTTICTGGFLAGTRVRLTARPTFSDDVFDSWSGADPCDATGVDDRGDPYCDITITRDMSIIAIFDQTPP